MTHYGPPGFVLVLKHPAADLDIASCHPLVTQNVHQQEQQEQQILQTAGVLGLLL